MLARFRLLTGLWLALALPLGPVVAHCLPPASATGHCGHEGGPPDHGSHQSPGGHSACLACCCLPASPQVASRDDVSRTLRLPVQRLAGDLARRVTHAAAPRYLLPFAIAPPVLG